MSASISCSEALAVLRRGERLPADVVRALGEEQPGDFFRLIVEALADSFDPADAAAYEDLMSAWLPAKRRAVTPVAPDQVDRVYVLSRVTLGSDIKITSIVLDAMKRRYPGAEVVLAGDRKSAELYAGDKRVTHFEARYPRSGPMSARLEFAAELRRKLEGPRRIVVDPDSRLTQLGLVPVCEPENYFHFPSRVASGAANLTALTQQWLERTFGVSGEAYIAPEPVLLDAARPRAAVSLGVGGNDAKRVGGDFETALLRALGERFATVWLDRGAGGEEARRVTAAAEASGMTEKMGFREGSFAEFASVIAQCELYCGYDSAGQHAAAAAGIPLITVFAGAPSERFRQRWAPSGRGAVQVINADSSTPTACIAEFVASLDRISH